VRSRETPQARARRIGFQNFEAKLHLFISGLQAEPAPVSLAGRRDIATSPKRLSCFGTELRQ
jgi:hypothetical protein